MVPPSPDELPAGGSGSEAKGGVPAPSRVHDHADDPIDSPSGAILLPENDAETLSLHSHDDVITAGYGRASTPTRIHQG